MPLALPVLPDRRLVRCRWIDVPTPNRFASAAAQGTSWKGTGGTNGTRKKPIGGWLTWLSLVKRAGWHAVNVWKTGILLLCRIKQVVAGTGPLPICGLPAKFALHGVVMDVVQRSRQGLRREKIPIKAGALLPKPKTGLPRPFANRQTFQQGTPRLKQQPLDLFRERLLPSSQKPVDVWFRSPRIDEQMNVFRHVNERQQVKGSLFAGRIHTTRQPSTPIIIRQQRHPPITREGQFVKVTGLVVVLDSLSVRLIARHAVMV